MATPFLSQISIFAFNFPPKGWALCNGQTLPINQNQALFSLLGTTYGGNGQTTFLLPNLQGRTPVHVGSNSTLGQAAGTESVTLLLSQIPSHTHAVAASTTAGTSSTPAANTIPADLGKNAFSPDTPNTTMAPATIGNTGGTQPHSNFQPYTVLNFCISLTGIFPSRN